MLNDNQRYINPPLEPFARWQQSHSCQPRPVLRDSSNSSWNSVIEAPHLFFVRGVNQDHSGDLGWELPLKLPGPEAA